MKSSLASTTASIRGWTLFQSEMTTSLSMSAIPSKILALREARTRVLWGCLLTSLSTSLHMKSSNGLQSFKLGGQISLDQWSFRLAFRQSWAILAVFWVARPQNPLSLWSQMTFFVLILSWEARFSWTMVRQVGLQPVQSDFGCVLGGQATKSTVVWGQKNLFCVNFGQEWHLPPQHPWFWFKTFFKR